MLLPCGLTVGGIGFMASCCAKGTRTFGHIERTLWISNLRWVESLIGKDASAHPGPMCIGCGNIVRTTTSISVVLYIYQLFVGLPTLPTSASSCILGALYPVRMSKGSYLSMNNPATTTLLRTTRHPAPLLISQGWPPVCLLQRHRLTLTRTALSWYVHVRY